MKIAALLGYINNVYIYQSLATINCQAYLSFSLIRKSFDKVLNPEKIFPLVNCVDNTSL